MNAKDEPVVSNDKLSWLLGAIGLTGVLVALGYTVLTAQGDLLGVSIYDSDRTGYLLAAGDLIVHTFLMLLSWPTAIVLAIAILLVIGLEVAQRRLAWFVHARSFLALVVVVLCALQLTFFVLPATPISNTLVDSVCPERFFAVSRLIQWRTQELWRDTLCSRVVKEVMPVCGTTAPGEYLAARENNFLAAVLIGALLWTLGLRVLLLEAANSPNWSEVMPWPWAQVVMLISLLLLAIGVAYLYGKTVQSTTFPLVQVDFAQGVTSLDSQETSGTEAANHQLTRQSLYLIANKNESAVLYDPVMDRVLFVRKSAINYEKASSLKDVLTDRITRQVDTCGKARPN